MNFAALYRIVFIVFLLACVEPGRTANPEANPIEPGEILRKRAQKKMADNREKNRRRLSIPEAVGENVVRTASAQPLPPPLPPPKPSFLDDKEEYVRLALACILAGILTARILGRHRREAEIRALCGGYLSDGTEVASYKLPEWFAPAPVPAPQAGAEFMVLANPSSLEVSVPNVVAEFLAKAPERLAGLREKLKVLNATEQLEERQKVLRTVCEMVCELKDNATIWDLRPAWQMSSALELLLKRIVDKPKDATPSVIRSVAAAVDMLHEVCVPGIRPSLLTEPPIKILAVDDDALCRRALQFALEKANLATDLAETGEKAVELATANNYDVVFMDIQMPGIDGMAACMQIRNTKKNSDVPVIFVTVKSDFSTRAQSRLKGGTDLMAKPFLVFELTVRAVTFAMRKRLQLSGNSKRDVTSVMPVVPATPTPSAPIPTAAALPSEPKDAESPGALAPATPMSESSTPIPNPPVRLSGDFFREVPAYLAATRKNVEELRNAPDKTLLSEQMGDLYLRIHAVANKAGLAHLPVTARVSSTLEALLKRLYRNPKTVTASTLNTVSGALKLLQGLCVPGVEAKLAELPSVQILVVDDEPLARRAVVGALQLAFEKPESANDGFEASALAAQKVYDVIFTDVHMPTVNGYELCSDLRGSGPNRATPVVFITNDSDAEAQAKAIASGGNDFLGKPFLPIEITVKALTYAWDGRLKKIMETSAPAAAQSHSPAPEETMAASLAA